MAYFKINYLIITLSAVAIAFITHPGSLFVLAALVASWLYVFVLRTGPLEINGRQLRCACGAAAQASLPCPAARMGPACILAHTRPNLRQALPGPACRRGARPGRPPSPSTAAASHATAVRAPRVAASERS